MNIWNILHDGEITAIQRIDSNNIKLFVSIPYLRRRIEPLGDSFILLLSEVSTLKHIDFSDKEETVEEILEYGGPEILGCESESRPYIIDTTMGKLFLDYKEIEIQLENEQPITESALAKICNEYWEEWKNKWGKNKKT